LSDDAKVRRPARTLLQLLNAREKVFRPQGFLFFRKRSRCQPVTLAWQKRVTGFCIFNFTRICQEKEFLFALAASVAPLRWNVL
jgi:hypothetical protein